NLLLQPCSAGPGPCRLIQYPVAPCKGRITVTKEDLACLDAGEFLNDVIIDFYLKYLLLEGVGGSVAERSHIFSSFFYKQLSRRDRHTRHQRVKTWTRHVDIFTKDFLFVPVNQDWNKGIKPPGAARTDLSSSPHIQRRHFSIKAALEHLISARTCQLAARDVFLYLWTVFIFLFFIFIFCIICSLSSFLPWLCNTVIVCRPCLLVMDSLKLSYHDNVLSLFSYLQVEWEVRRKSPRLFTSDTMKSFNCRVPQQDNSSDCGLYLLQYVESFLQNPVVHFDIPLRLESWFPRQRARQKRDEIRSLIMSLHQSQLKEEEPKPSPSR
uniref:Ubiquitin-like protease family profile domain-containing protein n=1 Tax=Astatotilapia calliptera TaxID=8154 RepID=A0AAX7UBJ1_ASTCA